MATTNALELAEDRVVTLRYLDPGADSFAAALLASVETETAAKGRIFDALKLAHPNPGESWLGAWVRLMAEENGCDVPRVQRAIRDSVNRELGRFIWVLA